MIAPAQIRSFYIRETESLLNRLDFIEPFSLTMSMVNAARISKDAEKKIDTLIRENAGGLKKLAAGFITKIKTTPSLSVEEMQRSLVTLKLRFNSDLDQIDIFSDAVSQRGEFKTGVLMAGLDRLAKDCLMLDGVKYDIPPMVCYLERGLGAAIRRVMTNLPGGKKNPVAVIQVPRERIPCCSVASSLAHETGHQGSALLGLTETFRKEILRVADSSRNRMPWQLFSSWVSEILADFWSVAKLGVGSALSLIGVLSLPYYFVFKYVPGDPHPFPYVRVKICCMLGQALFPDRQWQELLDLWNRQYPVSKMNPDSRAVIASIESEMPMLVSLLINYKPLVFNGRKMSQVFQTDLKNPGILRELYNDIICSRRSLITLNPVLVFATLGQAKMDKKLISEKEGSVINKLLTYWAKEIYEN